MTADRIAWPLCGGTLALAVAAGSLGLRAGAPPGTLSYLVSMAACALVGGLVVRHRPANAVGWLLLGSAFCFTLLEACGQYAVNGFPFAAALAWPQTWLWVPGNIAIALLPLFFPDGRLDRRWRPYVWTLVALGAAAALAGAVQPGRNDQIGPRGRPNPLGIDGLAPLAQVTSVVFTLAAGALLVAGTVRVIRQAATSTGVRREQARWLAYALGLVAVVVLVRLTIGLSDDDPARIWPPVTAIWDVVGGLSIALIPIGVGIAILRHGLFDIDLLISRSAVYIGLSLGVAAAYLVVVGWLGASSVLAAVGAAFVFAPLRQWLQRRVNLLVYGERDDPYTVLARLGRRLEEVPSPGAILATSTATVREALGLSYVGIRVADGPAFALGTPPAAPTELPLMAGGEPVGTLSLGPRPGESALGPRDLRLLRDLARHIGVAAQAVRFAADLQRSRAELVVTREEERRRLRRDLHDGLGPTLAGLTMRAEAVQEMGPGPGARRLLEEIVEDARTAVHDVRRLVEGLRPPALDTLGLVGALRSHVAAWPAVGAGSAVGAGRHADGRSAVGAGPHAGADQHSGAGPYADGGPDRRAGRPAAGGGLAGTATARGGPRVVVEATDVPPLPAATEVAAYRIAVEALANARRHAGATEVCLRLGTEDGRLTVEVADDGRGEAAASSDGVGMHSMRERAAELGGTLEVTSSEDGTRVVARLPREPDRG